MHKYPYGLIGNCSYLALIDQEATVQWLCWPNFDSSFLFGGMLDPARGGSFRITPAADVHARHQAYIENTVILQTDTHCTDGSYRVTDFAPRFPQYDRFFKPRMLVRRIEPLQGNPRIRIHCDPRGDYGELIPDPVPASNHIAYRGYQLNVRLTTNVPLSYILAQRDFVLERVVYLVLTYGQPLEAPLADTAEDFLRQTERYWQTWTRRCSVGPLFQEQVIRSALTLKIHQFEDTGAIIASATTSLPEHPGSGRTWDYRYCWMRDSYYTLKALHDIGHFSELAQYASYIRNIAAADGTRYAPVYNLLGNQDFPEQILDLDGYLGNGPVRVGNQALEHVQNDVYGQILVSFLPLYVDRRLPPAQRNRDLDLVRRLLRGIEWTMEEADAGLWEFRNLAQQHCYTFLFHWAGAKAAVRIGQAIGDRKLVAYATRLCRRAVAMIEKCYDAELGTYTQAVGSRHMDASLLHLITMNYLKPGSPKAARLMKALEAELAVPDSGLFYRYRMSDDFGKPQSTFLVCAFWHVEALATLGRADEALRRLESLQQYANHVGLFSEDVDPRDGSQWGNFPQTYSHVGMITATARIERKLDLLGYQV